MKKIVYVVSVLTALSSNANNPSTREEILSLKKQIQSLEDKIGKLENSPIEISINSEEKPEIINGKTFWKIPGTSTKLALHGFFKLTCIKDFDGSTALAGDPTASGRNFLAARLIGLDGVKNVPSRDFFAHARETRVAFETVSPIDGSNISTCIEFDFLGDPTGNSVVANNYNPRLRRAFAKFGNFLIGQDWSTYSDVSTLVETVDRNGPVGKSQVRQPLIRYTHSFEDSVFNISAENPESEFITQNGSLASTCTSITGDNTSYVDGIKGENRIPDIVASFEKDFDWGFLRFAGVIRENSIRRESDSAKFRKIGTFGGSSLLLDIPNGDELVMHVGYGSGGGRYFMDALKAATYFDGTKLHNQNALHFSASYKHIWNQDINLRSTFAVGYLRNLNCKALTNAIKDGTIATNKAHAINKHVLSYHLNLIGNVNKSTQLGIEYVVGKRKSETQHSGTLQRITFAVQVNF